MTEKLIIFSRYFRQKAMIPAAVLHYLQ